MRSSNEVTATDQAIITKWTEDPAIRAEVWKRLKVPIQSVVGSDPSAIMGHVFNHLLGFNCPTQGKAVIDLEPSLWFSVSVEQFPTFEAFIKYVLDANAMYASDMKNPKPVTTEKSANPLTEMDEAFGPLPADPDQTKKDELDKFVAHWKKERVSIDEIRPIMDAQKTDWLDADARSAAYHAVGTYLKEKKAKAAAAECARQLVAELGITYDDVPKALAVEKLSLFGDWSEPATTDKALEMVRTWKKMQDAKPKEQATAATDVADTKEQPTIRSKYTANIQGREYFKAAGRIAEFRKVHQKGTILTEMLQFDGQIAVFKASVHSSDGVLLATAHAMITAESAKNVKGRFVEMCETNAVARALGLAGFGTEILEHDDDDALADSPVETK